MALAGDVRPAEAVWHLLDRLMGVPVTDVTDHLRELALRMDLRLYVSDVLTTSLTLEVPVLDLEQRGPHCAEEVTHRCRTLSC